MFVEAYGEYVLGKSQRFEWFTKFKRGDFVMKNEERGTPKEKFEDRTLSDEDDVQTQQLADQLRVTREAITVRLKDMGKIQKVGKWVARGLN